MADTLHLLNEYVKRKFISQLYTSLPAEVIRVDEFQSLQVVDVKPLISSLHADGVEVKDPVIYKVPVILLGGGGALISVPIAVGDKVMLCFSMKDIDTWKQGNGKGVIADTNRLHDITDAVAIPGLFPQGNNLGPDAENLKIKYKGSEIAIKKNGDVTIDGPNVLVNGGGSGGVVCASHVCAFTGSPHPQGSTTFKGGG